MEILNLGGENEDANIPTKKLKKNKNLKIALGVGTLAVMVGLGSTLAANISLNNSGPVEFGQGVAQTISCQQDLQNSSADRSITVTPISDFQNTGLGTFVLSQIQFSGIDIHQAGYNFNASSAISGPDMVGHTGQYIDSNGYWQNTCDGKWLIVKAYTDTAGVANASSGYREAGTGYNRTISGTAQNQFTKNLIDL